jgi:hypothetical protein
MGKGRAAGRVRFFVGNRGPGQLFAETGGSGPRKVTRPWTTLGHVQLYIAANGKMVKP